MIDRFYLDETALRNAEDELHRLQGYALDFTDRQRQLIEPLLTTVRALCGAVREIMAELPGVEERQDPRGQPVPEPWHEGRPSERPQEPDFRDANRDPSALNTRRQTR